MYFDLINTSSQDLFKYCIKAGIQGELGRYEDFKEKYDVRNILHI